MSATFSVIKTLFIPAIISLVIFLTLTYVLIPLWRQYRTRYSHYLPIETISTQTSSLRIRVQNAITQWIASTPWRWDRRERVVVADDDESDIGFSSEDGEELNEVGEDGRHALSLDSHHQPTNSDRRLSRDLEEGFRDDSDDDSDQDNRNNRNTHSAQGRHLAARSG